MHIIFNGKKIQIQSDLTIKKFMNIYGYNGERVAIECNGKIISKHMLENIYLKDEDHLEIVTAVGGG